MAAVEIVQTSDGPSIDCSGELYGREYDILRAWIVELGDVPIVIDITGVRKVHAAGGYALIRVAEFVHGRQPPEDVPATPARTGETDRRDADARFLTVRYNPTKGSLADALQQSGAMGHPLIVWESVIDP